MLFFFLLKYRVFYSVCGSKNGNWLPGQIGEDGLIYWEETGGYGLGTLNSSIFIRTSEQNLNNSTWEIDRVVNRIPVEYLREKGLVDGVSLS